MREHCSICDDFRRFTLESFDNVPLREFLSELWMNHQDRTDDTRCWNAWCEVFAPDLVVEVAADA